MMADELLNAQDLITAKKHDTFHSEVITGKTGGVSTGANIDYATNAVTGQVQKTLPATVNGIDWSPVGNLTTDNCTFTKSTDYAVDDIGTQWAYNGTFPFTSTAPVVPSAPDYYVVHVNAAEAITNANGGSVQDFIDAQYTTVTELATGNFQVGQYVRLIDRDYAVFKIVSGGVANGFDVLVAGGSATAVVQMNSNGSVTPKNIGAIADGLADDSNLIDRYLSLDLPFFDWGGYKYACSTPVYINTGSKHVFSGTEIKALTAGMSLLYADQVSDWSTSGDLYLYGTGDGESQSVTSSEVLFRIRDCRRFKSENITLKNTTGRGLFVQGFTDFTLRAEKGGLVNFNAYHCQTGFDFDAASATGAEFLSVGMFSASACFIGANIEAGNISWVGGNLTDNAGNLTLGTGANALHGSMTGVNINHASGWNIKADDVANGFNFIGCHMYGDGGEAGRIELNNSQGIMFTGGVLSSPLRNNAGSGTNNGFNQINGMLVTGQASIGGDDAERVLTSNNMGLGSFNSNNFNKSRVITPFSLINSWVQTAGRRTAGYYFDSSSGDVVLTGAVGGGSGAIADALPLGYRPSGTIEVVVSAPVGTTAGVAYILISSNGVITYISGNNTKVSLEGIRFSTR